MKSKAAGAFSPGASSPWRSGFPADRSSQGRGGAAVKRTLDGEDHGERIAEGGERYGARRAIFSRWHELRHPGKIAHLATPTGNPQAHRRRACGFNATSEPGPNARHLRRGRRSSREGGMVLSRLSRFYAGGRGSARQQTRLVRFTRKAHFPFFKTIEEFDFKLQSTLRKTLLGSYLGPDFVNEGAR